MIQRVHFIKQMLYCNNRTILTRWINNAKTLLLDNWSINTHMSQTPADLILQIMKRKRATWPVRCWMRVTHYWWHEDEVLCFLCWRNGCDCRINWYWIMANHLHNHNLRYLQTPDSRRARMLTSITSTFNSYHHVSIVHLYHSLCMMTMYQILYLKLLTA